MYQLETDEDFFYAIATAKEVSFLSLEYIGGGPIQQFNDYFVKVGDEFLSRFHTKFFFLS